MSNTNHSVIYSEKEWEKNRHQTFPGPAAGLYPNGNEQACYGFFTLACTNHLMSEINNTAYYPTVP